MKLHLYVSFWHLFYLYFWLHLELLHLLRYLRTLPWKDLKIDNQHYFLIAAGYSSDVYKDFFKSFIYFSKQLRAGSFFDSNLEEKIFEILFHKKKKKKKIQKNQLFTYHCIATDLIRIWSKSIKCKICKIESLVCFDSAPFGTPDEQTHANFMQISLKRVCIT